MTVFMFENFVRENRLLFKHAMTLYEKEMIAKMALDKCTNSFEEQCIVEVFREELRP